MNAPAYSEIRSYSSRMGTQREYEIVLVLRPEQNKQQIAELLERIGAILTTEQASLLEVDNWGMRTLAFPIKRSKRGIYLYLRFLGGSDTVAELERNFRIREDVIRYLTVRVDDDVDPAARPSQVDAEALESATISAPDPVEIMRAKEEEERKIREAEAAAAAAVRAKADAEAAAVRAAKAAEAAEAAKAAEAAEAAAAAEAPEATPEATPEAGDAGESSE